jgi:predicted GIY-YIG superfamily endonuclease
MTYHVYELWISGEDREFYIGYTNNLAFRKYKHIVDSGTRESHLRKGRKIAAALSDGKDLEIVSIFETDDMQEALNKEVALIKERGRLDLGSGHLYNLTDGGDGHRGYTWSDQARQKKSESMKGISRNKGNSRPDARARMSIPVFAYTRDGEFLAEYPSAKAAAQDLGCVHSNVAKCARGAARYTTADNNVYQFSRTKVEALDPVEKTHLDPRPLKTYALSREHRDRLSESIRRAKSQSIGMDDTTKEKIKILRTQGLTLAEISSTVGWSISTISKFLRSAG